MPPAQQTETAPKKTAVFDEQGQTIEETVVEEVAPPQPEEPEVEAAEEPPADPPTEKYRIGDRTFATQEEALAYAQQQVEADAAATDAYRQGLLDAQTAAAPRVESVTPPPELNTEELYTNPQAFLDKFANKIKTETRSELDQKEAIRTQSEQIWREFTDRHPALAEFRTEVETFVAANQAEVRALATKRGRTASYDFIATKLRSRFEAYASAVKPKRELPNNGTGAPPAQRAAGVTPKGPQEKPLSFAEQIRSIRKRR